ncbi:MAG: hypothetical protein FWD71_17800 [Oscillospiraceae bacterium]|nr:hypothetical protein [Oscillospiraceae bacterium]
MIDESNNTQNNQNRQKKKDKTVKIILAAVLCVGIISAGSFALLANASDNNNNTNSTNSTGSAVTAKSGNKSNADMKKGMRGMDMGMGRDFFNPSDVATFLGITQDELQTRLDAANGNIVQVLNDAGQLDAYKAQVLADYKTKLDDAVTAGKMTQDQADKQYASEQTKINSITADTSMPFGGDSKMARGGMDMGMACMGGYDMATAASVMGITQDELKTQVQTANGNLFKVLEEAGKMDAYKAQVLANCKTKLDAAVTAGKMTQADADTEYAKMQTTVNNFSSSNAPSMNFKGGQRGSRDNWNSQKNQDGQATTNNPDSGITPFVPGNYQNHQNKTSAATTENAENQGI